MGELSQADFDKLRGIMGRRAARKRAAGMSKPVLMPGPLGEEEDRPRTPRGTLQLSSLMDIGGAGLRYLDRAARLTEMGVGTAIGANPFTAFTHFIPGVKDWMPDVERTPEAIRAFNKMRQQGDWDAAISAYTDVLDAGPGFWGTAGVLGSFIPTGGPALAGAKLISAAPKLAGTIAKVAPLASRPGVAAGIQKGLTGTGKVLRAPWEAEEAVGRLAARGIGRVAGPVVRPIVSRFRRPAAEAAEEVPLGMAPDDVVDADDLLEDVGIPMPGVTPIPMPGAPRAATEVLQGVPLSGLDDPRPAAAPVMPAARAVPTPAVPTAGVGELAMQKLKFPKGLGTSKPNYGLHPLSFASDVDNALYIISKSSPVEGDAKFIRWLTNTLGVEKADLIAEGRVLRAEMKRLAPSLDPDDLIVVPPSKYTRLAQGARPATSGRPVMPAARNVDDLARERDALEEKLYEIQVEIELSKDYTPGPKVPRFGTRERAEYDALRMKQSEAGIPIRTKKWRQERIAEVKAEEQRLKQDIERIDGELDAAFAMPPEGMAGEAIPPIPRPRQPGVNLDEIIPDEQAADYIKASHPAGGDPPTGGPPGGPPRGPTEDFPTDLPSGTDDIFEAIRRVATKGESITEALLRRHEGALTAAENEAQRLAQAGEKVFRKLGLSVGRFGREVIREDALPEMDALFRALHEPEKFPVPPRLQGVYDELRRLTDWEQASRLAFDPNVTPVEHYFFRGWKPSDKLAREFQSHYQQGGIGWPPAFRKPRADATYSQMRALGFEPLNWNPFEQWRISRMQGMRSRQQMMLIASMKKAGIAKPAGGGPSIKGWRTPEVGPAFEGKPLAYIDEDGAAKSFWSERWVVPENAAKRLENIYGKTPSLGKVTIPRLGEVDVMKVIDAITFIPKRAKLMFSFFQQQDFLTRSLIGTWTQMVDQVIAGKPIGAVKALAKWPKSAYSLLRANLSPDYTRLLKQQLSSTEELVPGRPGIHFLGMIKAGLSIKDASIFPVGMDVMARSVAEEGGFLGVRSVMRLVGQMESAMRRGLFDGVYPAAQMMDIKNNMVHVMVRQFPDATDEAINGMVARVINLKYSTVPASQSMFQNQTARAFLQRAFFSVGESEGLLRQGVQAVKGPYAAVWRKHWLAAYLALLSTANVIHFASTGQALPLERYTPVSEDNFGLIPFGYNARFAAPTIPISGRSGTELTLDIVGQMDTVLRLTDPVQFISSRESVPVRAVVNQVKGTDFFGAPIDEVGPGGIASRTAMLVLDLFAPIGPGQAAADIAREQIPLVGELLPPGEERIGLAGQLIQAPGIGIRGEPTKDLLRRTARESGEVVQLSTHPRFGQPAQEWDELTKPQQRSILEKTGMEEELAFRTETGALRGTEGSVLRQRRIVLEDETAGDMEKVAEQYLRMPRETGGFVAEDARNAIGKALSRHYIQLEDIYKDLEEGEEPAENTLRHHMWRYRQIFVGFGEDGPQTSGDWEDFNKAVARFWSDIPEEDVGVVLGEMRQLEQKFPEEIRMVQEAKRYASAFEVDVNGTRYSYWDLDTIPEVEKDILYKSWEELGSTAVTIDDVRDYLQKSTAARSAGKITSRGKAIDKAFKASSRDGMLSAAKENFVAQAPTEWVGSMLDAGYHFKGKEWIWENLGEALRGGAKWKQYPYRNLYEEVLVANR